ncbi:bacteriophage abortive infection AbiH family protein [Seonamhaeicola sp. MEBiC1930]|uniref:AbiH family protein n=1 Tax=Seonamhaeicola sp. MEBiC01930 TaxID=2976768 RepID=UPI00324679DB
MIKRDTILIIGNGFDLAHGMPTSYNDFAQNYLKVIAHSLINNDFGSIVSPSFIDFLDAYRWNGPELRRNVNHRALSVLCKDIEDKRQDNIISFLNGNPSLIGSVINNRFLAKLYNDSYINWFDIENAFFEELVRIKNDILNPALTHEKQKERIHMQKKALTRLNNELNQIKEALKTYLSSLEIKTNDEIKEFFRSSGLLKRKFHIINFNYTSTMKSYLDELFTSHSAHLSLNIHGSLKDKIIFGYGNDHDHHYQEMKNLGLDEFLENFKTFDYLDNRNYIDYFKNELIRLRSYDVVVMGHSLDQTDKTLLSKIVNSTACEEIHLLKRGDLSLDKAYKAYRTLLYALSRIITNDDTLRDKVVNFEDSVSFPQNYIEQVS